MNGDKTSNITTFKATALGECHRPLPIQSHRQAPPTFRLLQCNKSQVQIEAGIEQVLMNLLKFLRATIMN